MSDPVTIRCKDCNSDYDIDGDHARYADASVFYGMRHVLAQISRLKKARLDLYDLKVNNAYVDEKWFETHAKHHLVFVSCGEEWEPREDDEIVVPGEPTIETLTKQLEEVHEQLRAKQLRIKTLTTERDEARRLAEVRQTALVLTDLSGVGDLSTPVGRLQRRVFELDAQVDALTKERDVAHDQERLAQERQAESDAALARERITVANLREACARIIHSHSGACCTFDAQGRVEVTEESCRCTPEMKAARLAVFGKIGKTVEEFAADAARLAAIAKANRKDGTK